MKITLLGCPLSTNNIYKIRCAGKFPSNYMSKEGATLKKSYQEQANKQWTSEPLESDQPVEVTIGLWFNDKRVRDIDNYFKIALDSLTGVAWEDDSQIVSLLINKFYEKGNPRIELSF